MASFPPSGGADQAISNNAEPEVHDQADVELEWAVARQRERGRKKEVGRVAENDGTEGLNQIDQHRGFRHQLHWGRITRAGHLLGKETSFATAGRNPNYRELLGLSDF